MVESESDFQGWIVDTAKRFGWRVWHAPTPMRPIGGGRFVPDKRGAGLPDLVMIHDAPPRLIMAEVKKVGGVLSDEQQEFLSLARKVAVRARDALSAAVTVTDAAGSDVGFTEVGPLVGVYVWRPEHRELIEATLR